MAGALGYHVTVTLVPRDSKEQPVVAELGRDLPRPARPAKLTLAARTTAKRPGFSWALRGRAVVATSRRAFTTRGNCEASTTG